MSRQVFLLQRMDSLVVACGLSSCSARAWLLYRMGDLSSLRGDRTRIPCLARWILNHWTTREIPKVRVLIELGSDLEAQKMNPCSGSFRL